MPDEFSFPDKVRASEADREVIVEHIRQAYGDGRLTLEELNDRIGSAYSAQTYRELRELIDDLPVRPDVLPAAGPPAKRVPDVTSDPVRAYLTFRYRQYEWMRSLARRPAGQRGVAALFVGRTAVLSWLSVNMVFLLACLGIGLGSGAWEAFAYWPLVAAPWGAIIGSMELLKRMDDDS